MNANMGGLGRGRGRDRDRGTNSNQGTGQRLRQPQPQQQYPVETAASAQRMGTWGAVRPWHSSQPSNMGCGDTGAAAATNIIRQPLPPVPQTTGLPKSAPIDDMVKKMDSTSVAIAGITISSGSALWPICPNKGAGHAGRQRAQIETNYLALNVANIKDTAYHYDITIEPDKPKRLLKAVFNKFRHSNFPETVIAFDGQKNAYAPKMLDFERPIGREIKIIDQETGQERTFLVSIKEVHDSAINLSCLKNYQDKRQYDFPMRAIQCIDIILKDALSNGVQVGRSFFTYPSRPLDLGDFYDLWTGLFQSTIIGSRPYINVDVAHKAFPAPMHLMDIVQGIYKNLRITDANVHTPLRPNAANILERHLRGLRIIYEMPGQGASTKGYKFMALGQTPDKEKFESDGQLVSVLQYFQSKTHPIRFANLPCLKVGNALRNIALPMEFCRIPPGQVVMKKCTEMQTRNMIRQAATSTDIRKQKLMDMLRMLQPNQSPTVQQFGLQISAEFAKINARILEAPMLEYGQRKSVKPQFGVWRAENVPFINPTEVQNWGVLILHDRTQRNAVDAFCQTLLQVSKGFQMTLNNRYFIEELRPRAGRTPMDRDIDATLNRIKANNANILFCVIPDSGDAYAKIKQSAELRCGVLTQCIKAATLFRKGTDVSTASNILLKVNAKLNGTNHKLQRSPVVDDNCMFIGADVTHPSPDQSSIPSVVGVAASHDQHAFQYNICWRLQDPRTEMIKDFQEIFAEQLAFYKCKNGKLPSKILYYRDGVSEGQFQEVLRVELAAMYAACKQDYKPKITMVVVQKRHHTRFFPGKSGIGDRKNNNVPVGTIVDTEIVHPNETHFYLVSHQSIQGVAKPTKYCVLHDDSNIGIDDLQALTFHLCHLFTRCNRSVSYPAPTYYAHLVAARGKAYIEGQHTNMLKLDQEYKQRCIQTFIVKDHPMYFV